MASQEGPSQGFAFKVGDLVLVKWNDGMVYFAKIKKIDYRRNRCIVVFDDKSNDEAHFSQIHSVDETTTDIICIKCKKDNSDAPNEIVLCDTCGIGFHQRCHSPPIPASALELDTPWNCFYCQKGTKCPFLTESLDVLQNLLSDDEQSKDVDNESVITTESDQFDEGSEDYPTRPTSLKKRKFKGKKPFGLRRKRTLKASSSPEKQPPKPANVPSADTWRHKLAAADRPHAQVASPEDAAIHSPGSGSDLDAGVRKRKRPHQIGGHKRQKLASVESHTVSVTRLPLSVCNESGTSPEPDQSRDSALMEYSDAESTSPSPLAKTYPAIGEDPPEPEPMRPRSLRVSLSLPEEIEAGSPFEKVVKASHKVGLVSPPKLRSPEVIQTTTTLPAWDDISTTTPTSTSASSLQNPVGTKTSNATAVASPPEAVDLPITPMVATPLPRDAPSFPSVKEETAGMEGGYPGVITSPKQTISLPSPPLSPIQNINDIFSESSNVICSPTDKRSVQLPILTPQVQHPITSVLNEVSHSPPKNHQQVSPPQPQNEAAESAAKPASQDRSKPATSHLSSSGKPATATVVATVITPALTQPSKLATSPVESPTHPFPQLVISTTSTPVVTHSSVTQPQPKSTHKSSVDTAPVSSVHVAATRATSQSKLVSSHSSPNIIAAVESESATKTHSGVIVRSAGTKTVPPTLQSDSLKTLKQTPSRSQQKETQSSPIRSQLTQGQSTAPITAPVKRVHQRKTTTALLHHVSPISSPSVHKRHERQARVRGKDASTRPVQSLVSSAMTSALASAMAGINGNTPDVVITSIEKKHSTPVESAKNPAVAAGSPVISHTTPNLSSQGRPQDLYKGKSMDSRAKKVLARTVEIQPVASTYTSSPHHTAVSAPQTQGAGSVVMPIASQTPVSVVQVVVSPPAYTPSGQEGQATYLIPAVGQGGQQITYAVPAGNVMPQYVIQDTPPYASPNNSVSPTLVAKPPVTPSTSVPFSQGGSSVYPYTFATPTPAQRQPNVVCYPVADPGTESPSSSGKNTPVSGVSITKPYAVVPALPSAEASKRGLTEYRVHGHGSHPGIQGAQYVRQAPVSQPMQQPCASPPVAGNTATKEVVYVHHNAKAVPKTTVATAYTTMTTGIKPTVMVADDGHRKHSPANAAVEIQEITKKIGDAFANCSEEKLISAFEDAWKKFQANGRKYEALSTASSISKSRPTPTNVPIRPQIPPNVEVVSVPGTTSRLSLVRPSSSRPKVIAPKATTSLATPVSTPSATPSGILPSAPDQQYIYTYATNTSQPQVIIQPVSSDYAIYTVAPKQAAQQKSYQVQSTGLFYPAPVSKETPNRANVSNPAPAQQIVIAQPAMQPQPKQPMVATPKVGATRSATTATVPMQQQQYHHSRKSRDSAAMARRRTNSKSTRACALCRKEATYLCSGCHAEWYCGRQCQLAAWDAHSEHCKA